MSHAAKCECGGSWTEDEHGSQSMKVCESCGKCSERVVFETEGHTKGSSWAGPDGPSSQGKCRAKRDTTKAREVRFINYVRDAAKKAQLNREGTDICITGAKSLVSTSKDVVLGKMEKFAAGIVFIEARKRTPTLTYNYFSQKFGMSKAVLGGVVKRLQAQGTFFSSRLPSGRLPFESRLEVVLDRFDHIDLKQGERKELKELAKDLKELCSDVPVSRSLILDNESSDFGYVALALVFLRNLEEGVVADQFSKLIGMKCGSFKNRLLKIREALLILAKQIPSLERLEKLSTRNVSQYIPVLRRNKAFLLSGSERLTVADLSDQVEPIPLEQSSKPLPSGWEDGQEDEGTLSDLDSDIEQYIASDKEVRKKRNSLSLGDPDQSVW